MCDSLFSFLATNEAFLGDCKWKAPRSVKESIFFGVLSSVSSGYLQYFVLKFRF